MENTSLAQITLDWIQCELNKGRTVNLSTYLKTIQITPRIAAQWERAGRDLFKIGDDGCLYIGRGKQYDCIAYSDTVLCQVTSHDPKDLLWLK